MPASVRQLAVATNLHDGRILQAVADRAARRLRLQLLIGDQVRGYFELTLNYLGVQYESLDLATLRRCATDGTVEILYDEIDRLEPGEWVHRLLFWPYRELDVTFAELALATVPRSAGRANGQPGEYTENPESAA